MRIRRRKAKWIRHICPIKYRIERKIEAIRRRRKRKKLLDDLTENTDIANLKRKC